MTTALWCVFACGLLPYVATVIAKAGGQGFDNHDPRSWLARQEGFRKRANFAQMNAFEVFPFFAAAVIIAQVLVAPQQTLDLLALGFVGARLLHLAFYLSNLATLRTLAWFAGLGCVIAIFVLAA